MHPMLIVRYARPKRRSAYHAIGLWCGVKRTCCASRKRYQSCRWLVRWQNMIALSSKSTAMKWNECSPCQYRSCASNASTHNSVQLAGRTVHAPWLIRRTVCRCLRRARNASGALRPWWRTCFCTHYYRTNHIIVEYHMCQPSNRVFCYRAFSMFVFSSIYYMNKLLLFWQTRLAWTLNWPLYGDFYFRLNADFYFRFSGVLCKEDREMHVEETEKKNTTLSTHFHTAPTKNTPRQIFAKIYFISFSIQKQNKNKTKWKQWNRFRRRTD